MSSLIYRPEIDGLRAIAVVSVILFHSGLELFAGGYIGVDVFFVISGYLIAKTIMADMERGTFSFADFYARRARRILPALLFVVVACIPFAWLLLLPSDAVLFMKSVAGVVSFSSNFVFLSESGYFQKAAELNPLLHTWSLAVEEQFYIVFPLLVYGLIKSGWRYRYHFLFLLVLAGLIFAEYQLSRDQARAFFLLPSRAWEFLVGVLLALQLDNVISDRIRHSGAWSGAGLLLILAGVLMFDSDTAFPGLAALVPVIGAGLVILCQSPGGVVQRILSCRLMVAIGLLSYSLYLWHQPVFAFLRHQRVIEASSALLLLVLPLVLLVSYLTWKYVEQPFRKSRGLSYDPVVRSVSVVMAALFGLAVLVNVKSDAYERFWLSFQNDDVRGLFAMLNQDSPAFKSFVASEEGARRLSDCRFSSVELGPDVEDRILSCYQQYGRGVLVFGDSHGQDLFGMTISRFDSPFLIGIAQGGCRPANQKKDCPYEQLQTFLSAHPGVFGHAVFEQSGLYLFRSPSGQLARKKTFEHLMLEEGVPDLQVATDEVDKTLAYLVALSGFVPVTWFGPRLESHIRQQQVQLFGCDYAYDFHPGTRELFADLEAAIVARLAPLESDVDYLSQNELMDFDFPDDFMNCSVRYWSDGDHLSASGEVLFGARLTDDFIHIRSSEWARAD